MYAVRRWSVRHARGLEILYQSLERFFVALHPLFKRLGYDRIEKPVVVVERRTPLQADRTAQSVERLFGAATGLCLVAQRAEHA